MTSMQVLLIGDELHTRSILSRYLTKEGFQVWENADGASALHQVQQFRFDLVVLEIGLPGLNGLELCTKIRYESRAPVLILTGKDNENDIIGGFEAGADDVVVKPFSPREVVHRISAIIRRTSVQVGLRASSSILFSRLCLDPQAHKVTIDGIDIELTPKEYNLLFCLVHHVGQSVSRESLLAQVWRYAHQGDCRTVDTHIKRLREKMNAASSGSGRLIQTVRGFGYSMDNSLEL